MSPWIASLLFLSLTVPAFAADPVPEAIDWSKLRAYQGGGRFPDDDTDVLKAMGQGSYSVDRFHAFENAYDFAVSPRDAGGLDMNADNSRKFAAKFAEKSNPESRLWIYKNAYYEAFGAGQSAKSADKTADQAASKGELPRLQGSLADATTAYPLKPDSKYGGGYKSRDFSTEIGKALADSDKSGEGIQKLLAFRELLNLICATTIAGGMDQCRGGPDVYQAAAQKALSVVKLPGAIARVELVRNTYHDALLKYKGPALEGEQNHVEPKDPAFDTWNRAVETALQTGLTANISAAEINPFSPGGSFAPAR